MKKRKGYWLGKKKDQHTLNRLSESKYKQVLQYDVNGDLIKTWDSIKSVAVNVFKDYRLVNNGSKSKIYKLLKCKEPKNKWALNSYWFSVEEIKDIFNGDIPQKINFSDVKAYYKNILNESRKGKAKYLKCYTVIEYNDNGVVVNKYDNVDDASDYLDIHKSHIAKCCRLNKKLNNGNYVKYGEKKLKFIKEYE